ncbi:hypothetical protein DCAR_0104099 [Daucus carota subsp. sativus]|uniref:Ribosomal RNA-processing protein 12-like conserved domain-containing protein n=1 Tax=Daucus carota subsp. sativus TaxID=79200 RepID=A0AAF1AIR8_DAUCS|nr:PREDICTED: RRP12-like protein isoform X1 [Daucus carota subsp. sativus]XP_017228989.1 PREDICTED: RRP12-like protein isoform X2 [Daucus carota subsp. sativus]WOG84914.1 hypothetical protein DCAR_0104099 [Daucus carota subsp. sativus]
MESPPLIADTDNFCSQIFSKYGSSTAEHHQHLIAVTGAMSQTLKDNNQPLSLIAYFGAACSSLDSISSESEPSGHALDSLLTILSLILPGLSGAVVKKKFELVAELVVRVLRGKEVSEAGVAAGLKCVACLVMVRGSVSWNDVSQLYGILLSYATDSRSKVRRQSHVCLRDVLQSFQGTAILAPASEAIANIFERFLLLAGGSNASSSEGPTGAQEVLYILEALKDCLPLLSLKSSTNILKYYKSLLELHQPLVTRRITDSLNVLCRHQKGEVSAEVLLDLLVSLAVLISTNETSADSMTVTARLLDAGMKKVFLINRQICVVKLPVVFSALADVMASEHEEPLYVAIEAFKSLICSCIDDTLIKQGVNQINESAKIGSRKSAPTIIEKVCATIESLLDYRYAAVWDTSLQVVSAMFDKLGDSSSYLLRRTLTNLADMQKLPDEDFPFRKQLHECVGSALVAMGPETFLSLLPLKLEAQDVSQVNAWLFPILKQYTVGSSLNFFTESIFDMISLMKKKSAVLEQEGKIREARTVDGLTYSLWSLLPSFCNYPLDTAESFKDLEKALCGSLRDEPDIRGVICSSLLILIQQNKKILEGNDDISGTETNNPRERALASYTPEVAAKNLNALRLSAREILSVLSGIFLKTSKDDGGLLQATIGEFASISDKVVVSRFYTATMRKLLKVTEEAGKAQNSKSSNSMEVDSSSSEVSLSVARAQLFDLAVSLLPGLDPKETDLLFVALEPALKDSDGMIQKKAYKVLSVILKSSDGFISRKLEELLNMMIEVLPCHFAAKRHRLDCLYYLIEHVSKDNLEDRRHAVIASFLTEIMLALKEANKKTRNRAYDIIVQIGHACGDENRGGKKENLRQYFYLVAGGLASETPHSISAAVKGLARLAYEFTDLVSSAYNVLPSALLLLQRKNREIIKANLGLLKVLVAKSHAEGLHANLKTVVEGLLNWQDSTKNHFKAKVKLLLEMLVKKCGLDAVRAVMPEEHMKLLTNIRKMKERKERKLAANLEETRSQFSKATTSRASKWNHTKIFSDFGDEDDDSDNEYMGADSVSGRQTKNVSVLNSKASTLRSKRKRKAAKLLPEDSYDQIDDEPLDLLDRLKTRSALRSSEQKKAESDDELEMDAEGRLIIHEEGQKPKREMPSEPDLESGSQAGSHVSVNSKKAQKRRKTSESGWANTGSEYASKKAAGDVKRKNKLEPYAYWPLDRKMVSRRPEQRAAARKGMSSVVKLTKKFEGKSVSNALSVKIKRGKKKANKKNR